MSSTASKIIQSAKTLSNQVDDLTFSFPVTHIYNPLDYAWEAHQKYIKKYGNTQKEILFLGMNPGPWGMAQTGVPFGEIAAVRDWMKITAPVSRPDNEHPKRPIEGFQTTRSEVSGKRLWGLFAERFPQPETFFKNHFVVNYCPLIFMEESSKNRTPDKLPASESKTLYEICDQHLQSLVDIFKPKWVVGVGGFAQKRAEEALSNHTVQFGKVLHPSPASPAANRGWAELATKQLLEQKIW